MSIFKIKCFIKQIFKTEANIVTEWLEYIFQCTMGLILWVANKTLFCEYLSNTGASWL